MSDGRRFVEELEATLERAEGELRLLAPRPGLWRDGPPAGALIRGGSELGSLEVLGRLVRLRAPAGAFGVVVPRRDERRLARRPVGHGSLLVALDPEGVVGGAAAAEEADEESISGPVFRTPLGGRFYARPSPEEPPFVKAGDALKAGETVALIEVMKTFNRVRYEGEPAKVASIVPADGDDVEAGDVLLELE